MAWDGDTCTGVEAVFRGAVGQDDGDYTIIVVGAPRGIRVVLVEVGLDCAIRIHDFFSDAKVRRDRAVNDVHGRVLMQLM